MQYRKKRYSKLARIVVRSLLACLFNAKVEYVLSKSKQTTTLHLLWLSVIYTPEIRLFNDNLLINS